MKLFEVMDTKVRIEWQRGNAFFNVADREVKVEFRETTNPFDADTGDHDPHVIEIVFSSRGQGEKEYTVGITNTGNQYRAFSGVVSAIVVYLKKSKPSSIMFRAKEESRAKLYDRMTSRVPGYVLAEREVWHGETFYLMTRTAGKKRK